jgi:hypothetical protein
MDSKTQPLEIYIVSSISNQGSANNYTTYEEIDHNQYWRGEPAIVELLHIIQQITTKDLSTNMSKMANITV